MINLERILKERYPNFFEKNPKFFTENFIKFIRYIFHEDEINNFLNSHKDDNYKEFCQNILDYLGYKYSIDSHSMQNIPESGKAIFIANHPLGGLDALSLIHLISKVRSDIKVMANDILTNIPQLKDIIIGVDNISGKITKESISQVTDWLKQESALIIFPAGEVSRMSVSGIKDCAWHNGFLKFAKKTSTPITPVYLGGKNSALFYISSFIYKNFSTLLLPNELFNKKNHTLKIIVGEPIPYENIQTKGINTSGNKSVTGLFKKHLYRLATKKPLIFKTQAPIIKKIDPNLITKELNNAKLLGQTPNKKSIYLASTPAMTPLLKEIARLREYTFRTVGEGTGKEFDADKYDFYYKHLVLFDEENKEIVGAYRFGESSVINATPNFTYYTEELCKYHPNSAFMFENSVELGRSFVTPKYWGSKALDYLWQGIGAYIKAYPQTRYLFGLVSISNSYPKPARDMLVYFYSKFFKNDEKIASHIEPYFLSDNEKSRFDEIFSYPTYAENLNTLKEHLGKFNAIIPTLYKQYTDLCDDGGVKFLAFGIDKSFNDAIDGLILVDISKIKEKKRKRYIG